MEAVKKLFVDFSVDEMETLNKALTIFEKFTAIADEAYENHLQVEMPEPARYAIDNIIDYIRYLYY